VKAEFEKVYTSINKLTASVNEGVEQVEIHTTNMKKKLQELRKTLIEQSSDVPSDVAAKNSELIKLQQKLRALKAGSSGKGKDDEIAEIQKNIDECNEQLKVLMSPNTIQNQKAVLCRTIIGIVDTLGQIAFRTLSDQFTARDAIKLYLCYIHAVEESGKSTDKKEKKEEKQTVERMSSTLLKSAGVFLEFGKQTGLELPPESLSLIKVPDGVPKPTPPTIAELTKTIDTQVRSLSHTARNEKGIDIFVADELLRVPDEMLSNMKKVESVVTSFHTSIQQAVKESQAAICVAEYEVDPTGFQIPPIRSLDEAIPKLKVLIKVLHSYLVPGLVATPLVYLHDKDWVMKSHSEFRAARRKELTDLEPHISATMPLDALRECIIEFANTFTQVLHVKIPAMHEVFADDHTILKRVTWGPERQILRDEVASEVEKLQNPKTKNNPNVICLVVQTLLTIMMRFLTYKPIARPHVFRSDAEWKLVSESKLRFELRKELLL